MKKIFSFLLSAWIASSLFAQQSWTSPDVNELQSTYHGKTIIDFRLVVDETEYNPVSFTPKVAAFIDGECRGESSPKTISSNDGSTISYHTITVYGDPTADDEKEITFRFLDGETNVEYILPQTYTFDGEHHGYPSGLEELSFTRVMEIVLADHNIYPGNEYNLNNFMTLRGENSDVTDDTQIVVTWRIGDTTIPNGFELDEETGILTISENAEAGKVNYYASIIGSNISAQGTLTLTYSVKEIEILKQEIELTVGSNIYQYVTVGEVYNVLPAAADQNVTITAEDKNIVNERGEVIAKGTTILTIASVENPEIKNTVTLNAYIPLTGFVLSDGENEYEAFNADIKMDRMHKKVLTLTPQPVGARVDEDLLDIFTYSTRENENEDFPHYKVEVESLEIECDETGDVERATITLHGWSIGGEALCVTYDNENNSNNYWDYMVIVGADFQLVDGWDWVTIQDSWFADENNSLNYLNSADYFGGGLIDVRSKTGNLYKDPVYGLYGSIDYMDNFTCYKLKFDRSQATELAEGTTSIITYSAKMEAGAANPYASLEKGWNWLAYPFEYDYDFEDLVDYFAQNECIEGDIILATDGSMATYSTKDGWVVPDEGFTFRYGKGYLYYTSSDRHPDLYWGDSYVLPQVDLTISATQAPERNRETAYWEYDAHRFPNKMAIVARLDGVDNPSNYTIGAFVDDECRGEGKVAKQWMFITVNGEVNEQITFRLIDKRTGICYDLTESIAFGTMAGSLKAPVCFNAGKSTAIEHVAAGALTVQGNVALAAGTIQVYDIQGKVVAEGFQRVDMSDLSSGIYVVKAGNQSRKVIK